MAQGVLKGQIQAFLDLNRREPGAWALAQGENSLLLRDGLVTEGNGALVELHRAIPIPKHDVPLAEILEFRLRRRDELLLLRQQLESFVSEIETSNDRPATLEQKIRALDEACANLLQLGKEWQFPVYLSNIKASFSLSPVKFLPAAGLGWKLGEPFGLAAATSVAAASGLVSTLEIKGDFGFQKIKRPASPYRYACHVHNELA